MKLGLLKKKSIQAKKPKSQDEEQEEESGSIYNREENEESEDSSSEEGEEDASPDSWMITDENKQRQALKQSQDANFRAPTTWLKDGEEKIFRFLDDGPIATIFRYSVRNRRGFFDKHTQPAPGQTDLFRDELNLNPAFCAVYEVIDKTGYKAKSGPKKGERVKNVNRFFEVSGKVHEQLMLLRKNSGALNKYDIKVARTGTEKNTAYMFFTMDRGPIPVQFLAKRLKKDFKKYYAPKTSAEQRLICRGHAVASSNDNE
jgi:DNA mismatch repair ATPase MutL